MFLYVFLLISTSHGWPFRHSLSKKSGTARSLSCPANFRNTVFNTNAAQFPGWPDKTWNSLTSNKVSNWIGFTINTIAQSPTYDLASGAPAPSLPSLDAAQIKISMDPSDVNATLSLITSGNAPQYLELYNEPDFSYEGFTPLTSPQAAAAALAPILAASTTTQFISPAVAFTNSDYLTQFNDACDQCVTNAIGIISAHIYNNSTDTVISMIEKLHSTWPTKRIWITELAPSSDPSQGCTLDEAGVINWMQTLLPQIVNLGYVDKVFWNSGEWSDEPRRVPYGTFTGVRSNMRLTLAQHSIHHMVFLRTAHLRARLMTRISLIILVEPCGLTEMVVSLSDSPARHPFGARRICAKRS
ncbi:hypothetical protein MMC13_008199 [Lambiella insularis]|nr:hypothetical protein [Lambiella insularis]